jgi:hypothetical protein
LLELPRGVEPRFPEYKSGTLPLMFWKHLSIVYINIIMYFRHYLDIHLI